MKKIILFLVFATNGYYAFSQNCNCLSELKYLENSVEENLPSYQDQVIEQRREAEYAIHKQSCEAIAAQLKDTSECIQLFAKYISFFRDEHFSIAYKPEYYSFKLSSSIDTNIVRSFFDKEKRIKVKDNSNRVSDPIEGLWQDKDKTFTVRIVKDKTPLRDFAGIIEEGDNIYWHKGQLKMDITKGGNNEYDCIYIRQMRVPHQYKLVFKDSVLSVGRLFDLYRPGKLKIQKNSTKIAQEKVIEVSELSPKTTYIKITSFDLNYRDKIDSVIKVNHKLITSKPNLIIDVRNNGGGGDQSYYSLLPLIMAKKYTLSPLTFSVWVSNDILKWYSQDRYKYDETKEDSIESDSTLAMMIRHKGQYTPHEFDTIETDTLCAFPGKVAIITNRWDASTTEGFVLSANQSEKVTQYGENTAGMISYGDWRKVYMPCLPIWLSMPTKKVFFRNNADLESIGIEPKIKLDINQEENWVKTVQADLEK